MAEEASKKKVVFTRKNAFFAFILLISLGILVFVLKIYLETKEQQEKTTAEESANWRSILQTSKFGKGAMESIQKSWDSVSRFTDSLHTATTLPVIVDKITGLWTHKTDSQSDKNTETVGDTEGSSHSGDNIETSSVQVISVLVMSIVTVTVLHYWKQKYNKIAKFREPKEEDTEWITLESFATQLNSTNGNHSDRSQSSHTPKYQASCDTVRATFYYLLKWTVYLMFACFFLSIPWEFMHLYQDKIAEKVSISGTGMPAECSPDQMSYFQHIKWFLSWQLSWSSDACLQYHRALFVDPIWHVSPVKVITASILHGIVYPLELLLDGLGRGLRGFFSHIPTPWQPVMLIVMVVMVLLVIIMSFGYRIHIPMLLRLEPVTPVQKQPRTVTPALTTQHTVAWPDISKLKQRKQT